MHKQISDLQGAIKTCKGLQADEVEQDDASRTIVRPVVEGGHVRLSLQGSSDLGERLL